MSHLIEKQCDGYSIRFFGGTAPSCASLCGYASLLFCRLCFRRGHDTERNTRQTEPQEGRGNRVRDNQKKKKLYIVAAHMSVLIDMSRKRAKKREGDTNYTEVDEHKAQEQAGSSAREDVSKAIKEKRKKKYGAAWPYISWPNSWHSPLFLSISLSGESESWVKALAVGCLGIGAEDAHFKPAGNTATSTKKRNKKSKQEKIRTHSERLRKWRRH